MESLRDGRFYIGSSTDLARRVAHHQGGFTHTTRRFGQLRLVFKQEFSSIEEAKIIERKLKQLKRKDYVEKVAREGKIRMRA